ncbi:MAG: methionine adenosyltransferase [Acidobacteriota bacterium]
MERDFLFTSESVTEGHPDKIADQVSDAILDAILEKDKGARVAVETLLKTGFCIVAGEVTTRCYVEIPATVRRTIQEIGYTSSEMGFDGGSCGVLVAIEEQSRDIAQGVDGKQNRKKEQGAGDQGMMFGFACDETPALMPAPITYAHAVTRRLAEVRKKGTLPFLRPDGKSQVTVEYRKGRPSRIAKVVVSAQHEKGLSQKVIREAILEEVVRKALPPEMIRGLKKDDLLVNPTGKFEIGGPMGDSGVTGRKIIVDTYGGMGRHGGGAFSGKDPSKVDRSAAYMARHIAKNIVAAGLARRCEVQLAYAIGVAAPVSVLVETFGTAAVPEERIEGAVKATFGLKPAEIIENLDLLRPIYKKTASYGHFGRTEPEFTWERTDKAALLRQRCGLKGEGKGKA